MLQFSYSDNRHSLIYVNTIDKNNFKVSEISYKNCMSAFDRLNY